MAIVKVNPMPRPRAEIGAVGLPIFSGHLGLDPNKNLRGREAIRTYRQMLLDEPAAGAFFTACRTLLRTDLQVQAGGDKEPDKRAAAQIELALDSMDASPASYLRQMQSAIWAGWNVSEQVYKRLPDGSVGWARWGLRRQESLERWEYDTKTGGVTAFIQRPAPTYDLRTIPLTKAIHVVNDDSEGSPEGRSALRGMYRQWVICKNVELLLGISLERFGTGIPVWEQTEDSPVVLNAESDEFQAIEAIAASIRQNEEAYVIVPKGFRFRFEPSPGLNAGDFIQAIQRFRLYMLQSVLAEFIALGTEGGSYALGEKKIDLFLMALNGFQERLCDALNRQAIPKLLRYNGIVVEKPPTVTLPAVRDYDLEKLGSFLSTLKSIGAFHPTPEDEAHLRKVGDLLDVSPDELEELFTKQPAPTSPAALPTDMPDSMEDQSDDNPEDDQPAIEDE